MTSPNINILDVGTFLQIKTNMKDEMRKINPNIQMLMLVFSMYEDIKVYYIYIITGII